MKSPLFKFLVLTSLFTLAGCNQSDDGEEMRTARQNLTPEEQRTLDFERSSDWYEWSNSSGVTLTSSTNASHGTHSLAVSGIGYAGLRNVNGLSKDGPAPEVVGYDLWIPEEQVNPWWHGNTSLTIDCPSAGIWSQWIGSQSFNDLPKGQFVRVEYVLPAWIRQALDSTNYNDLRFVVAINVESGSDTHYVDHFTLGPADTTCTPVDDSNSCTIDACDASTGQATHTPVPEGTTCDNGNVCDGVSTCSATGECTLGTPPQISDGNPCTEDSCDPVNGVTHTPVTAGTSCANENQCDGVEFCDAEGACQSGIPPQIDDEDPCTIDSCDPETGVSHMPAPAGTSCADGDACNGAEQCSASGVCEAGTPLEVSDGNPCTADSCDPVEGVTHTPVAVGTSCDDGDLCNGQSLCDEDATCVVGAPPEISDGNPCTADSCDPIQGVIHANVAAGVSCGEGDACRSDDLCDGAGACQAGTPVDPSDDNPCTADACDPVMGVSHTSVAAGTVCGEGDACHSDDVCDGTGVCQVGTPVDPSDDNPCTADACDSVTGVSHTPVAAGTICGEGDACQSDDVCDAAGACQAGTPVDPSDDNPCTADACDPVTGVSHVAVAAGTICGEGDACRSDDTCDGAGACQGGAPFETSDDNPCTTDVCDPVTGVSHTPVAAGTDCSDGDVCNGSETCNGAGVCSAGEPLDFDDGNICTIDSCDPEVGVVHQLAPAGTSCSDGDPCNGEEICGATGACEAGHVGVQECGVTTCSPEGDFSSANCSSIAPGEVTTISSGYAFLYEGTDPPQRGVAPGTIDPLRAGLISGRVINVYDTPIDGIRIEVLDHPELGYTHTQADGTFYFVANGGAALVLSFSDAQYLEVQRTVNLPWNSYAVVPDVLVTGLDPIVTTIVQNDSGYQVAASSLVEDQDGERQAIVAFPPGTTATMALDDGTTISLEDIHVRATEYTVGERGGEAMPGDLPASSGYTYAVELSVDEAILAGAKRVDFSQPVPTYVDNFLDMPVGVDVPTGYYDREKGVWVPSVDGRVIRVVQVNGGVAAIDINGDGAAESASALDAFGITSDEREVIGSIYGAGSTLWRVPVTHFTPWDHNFAYGPGDGDCSPGICAGGPDDPSGSRSL